MGERACLGIIAAERYDHRRPFCARKLVLQSNLFGGRQSPPRKLTPKPFGKKLSSSGSFLGLPEPIIRAARKLTLAEGHAGARKDFTHNPDRH